jgi:predicted ATPase
LGRFLITGCSGGGKSSLLAELARRGFDTVPEPGRRIVAAERDPESPRLPWNDPAGFARAALEMAMADFTAAADRPGPVLFDRGVLDALVGLAHATGQPLDRARAEAFGYDGPVFLAPPWPDIFATDAERRHDMAAARAEYDRIAAALDGLGWPVVLLPRDPVARRADLVAATLAGNHIV